jgi:hypothetical protein
MLIAKWSHPMKLHKILFAVLAATPLLFAACSHEVAHSESDKRGWFGEKKHTEDTVYKNADGTYSHDHQEYKVNP